MNEIEEYSGLFIPGGQSPEYDNDLKDTNIIMHFVD